MKTAFNVIVILAGLAGLAGLMVGAANHFLGEANQLTWLGLGSFVLAISISVCADDVVNDSSKT